MREEKRMGGEKKTRKGDCGCKSNRFSKKEREGVYYGYKPA